MAKIAFILLCHKDPEAIIRQAGQLTAAGDFISIHFDGRVPAAAYQQIREALATNPNVTFAGRRIKCGWGEWSLVKATLQAVQAALDAFPQATHFYLLSGDCMAVKSAVYAHDFLDANDVDYIESVDFFESGWIKTGMTEERLIYRYWFNERTQKSLYHWSLWTQRRLGLRREIPADLQMMIGSQWWCLRRRTIEAVMEFTVKRPDVMRFFRTTWIPDETFFQTLVRHLVPEMQIRSRTLTFLMFTDYGIPVTFHNDHYDLLLGQDYLFARKISPEALELKSRLGVLYASDRNDFKISNEGRRLFEFLTGRGRIGRRFAPRFWESEASVGRERELLIVTAKKWHVAKRLVASIRAHTDIPCIDYLFNEESTPLPDLGGIQATLSKRTRHRRALMRMLFDYYQTNRLLICLDTGSLDLMQDFYSDRSTTRLLEIDCDFTEDYLIGHARRVGFAGEQTSPEAMAQLLPTIRYDVMHESDRIRDAGFPLFQRIRQSAPLAENAREVAAFLAVSEDAARAIADTPYLFAD
ncbi:MAG: DUF5928 domain-containing protein [Rhodobacterales bacterium]|nr:DUF5928 domain-containing protein [Rhodobacterales bacterium]